MDKKEALNNIIYNLKEIEGTRIRLSSSKTETVDIELALLNQQVVNLYRHLQNYQSGVREQVSGGIEKPLVHESELKRVNNDAAQRKERLKRLEAEAEKLEAQRKTEQPTPAPEGELDDFTTIVEQKIEEEEVAHFTRNEEHSIRNPNLVVEQTLNEKLQSGAKTPESLNEKFAQADVKKTLAEKMKLGPIADLKSAIPLNQKIAFTNELFGGDDKEFKKALAFLNNSHNFSEAKFYLQSEVAKRYGWDDQNPLVEEFTKLVYRKFL